MLRGGIRLVERKGEVRRRRVVEVEFDHERGRNGARSVGGRAVEVTNAIGGSRVADQGPRRSRGGTSQVALFRS